MQKTSTYRPAERWLHRELVPGGVHRRLVRRVGVKECGGRSLRKKKIAQITELSAAGYTIDQIVEELDVTKDGVARVLGGGMPPMPRDQKIVSATGQPLSTRDELAEAIKITRQSHLMLCARLPAFVQTMMERIIDVVSPDEEGNEKLISPQALQAMMMAMSIAQSKQDEIIASLRNLESEAADDIDAKWEIEIIEDQDAEIVDLEKERGTG